MPYEKELTAAREAAAAAGREIMTLYAGFEAVANAPANVSTDADKRSQEVILQHLQQTFPGDAFCAEEATASLAAGSRQGSRLWIVDPIDGTRGFVKKIGEFSVMIALVENGTIALGVVLEPAHNRLTYAIRGQGCWKKDESGPAQPCHVSRTAELSQALMVQSRSDKARAEQFPIRTRAQRYTYSAGIKLAQVARAEADLYTSTYGGFNSWDMCAGQILVEEAGGKVTTMDGKTITYQPDGSGKINGMVASNGLLHEAALAKLRT